MDETQVEVKLSRAPRWPKLVALGVVVFVALAFGALKFYEWWENRNVPPRLDFTPLGSFVVPFVLPLRRHPQLLNHPSKEDAP